MAKRNSMSTARRSRNRKQEPVDQSGLGAASRSTDEAAPDSALLTNPANLAEIIADGRTRLMKAQAVLGCVAFTLLYDDWLERSHRPCFADAVNVAQDLIVEAIDRLDRRPWPRRE
jgi:hypothetical protein